MDPLNPLLSSQLCVIQLLYTVQGSVETLLQLGDSHWYGRGLARDCLFQEQIIVLF